MAGLDELASRLAGISLHLREAGETGLSRQLSAAIGKAVEPVGQEVREGLPSYLPARYAEVIADELSIIRRTFTTPDEARVVVYANTQGHGKRRLRRLDGGILWHPLFGRFPKLDPRNRWFEQEVKPGWFSDAAEAAAPRAREEIEQALGEILEEITK